jgi:hypothetical protein
VLPPHVQILTLALFAGGLLAVLASGDSLTLTLGGGALFWTCAALGGLAGAFGVRRLLRPGRPSAGREAKFVVVVGSAIGGGLLAACATFAVNTVTASGSETVRVDVTGRCRSEDNGDVRHVVSIVWDGRVHHVPVAEEVYARVAVAPQALDLETRRGGLGLPIIRRMRPVPLPIEIGRLPCERRES